MKREDAEAIAAKTAMDMAAELVDKAPIIDSEITESKTCLISIIGKFDNLQ